MNSTRTLKSIIVALLIALGLSLYINRPEITSLEGLCLDYSNEPKSELSVALVHKMSDNYQRKQLTSINSDVSNGFTTTAGDSRAIWFDLETLKAFLYHFEIEAIKNNAPISSEDLGVRIYYGSYPDNFSPISFPDLNGLAGTGYEEHHTLMMIPTLRINSIDKDFNPFDDDTYSNGLEGIPEYENSEPSNAQQIFGLTGFKKTNADPQTPQRTGAQNHGSLYPPLGEDGLNF